jgi:hypothetical protein
MTTIKGVPVDGKAMTDLKKKEAPLRRTVFNGDAYKARKSTIDGGSGELVTTLTDSAAMHGAS